MHIHCTELHASLFGNYSSKHANTGSSTGRGMYVNSSPSSNTLLLRFARYSGNIGCSIQFPRVNAASTQPSQSPMNILLKCIDSLLPDCTTIQEFIDEMQCAFTAMTRLPQGWVFFLPHSPRVIVLRTFSSFTEYRWRCYCLLPQSANYTAAYLDNYGLLPPCYRWI